MNSHAKFRGAARRGFSVIYEKPPGGRISAPPSVRGLNLSDCLPTASFDDAVSWKKMFNDRFSSYFCRLFA